MHQESIMNRFHGESSWPARLLVAGGLASGMLLSLAASLSVGQETGREIGAPSCDEKAAKIRDPYRKACMALEVAMRKWARVQARCADYRRKPIDGLGGSSEDAECKKD